jgi:hypothetical protein
VNVHRERNVRTGVACLVIVTILAAPGRLAAIEPAVARGVSYLKQHSGGQNVGEAALAALAMLKAEVPVTDPALAACLAQIRKRFDSEGYHAQNAAGADIYEAAVVAMVLANLDLESRRTETALIARYLMTRQKANGSWDYEHRTYGDSSISQYAVLGLWEASHAGAEIPPAVFDRAAGFYLSTQSGAGGWFYHGDEPSGETLSMTAAGVGSLLICQRQLAEYRVLVKGEAPSKLLTPLASGGPRPGYEVVNGPARIDPAVKRGLAWLAGHFSTTDIQDVGLSVY